MSIRAARPEEAALLSGIASAAKAFWGYSAETLRLWAAALTVTARAIEKSPTFVAELDSRVAGFYMLSNEGGVWELEHLWVVPQHMRKGIGKALLNHAAGIVRHRGGNVLRIDADPNAEAFYLSCGASRIGRVAAPIAQHPRRVRPILELRVAPTSS